LIPLQVLEFSDLDYNFGSHHINFDIKIKLANADQSFVYPFEKQNIIFKILNLTNLSQIKKNILKFNKQLYIVFIISFQFIRA
jgi:hypothetical protein